MTYFHFIYDIARNLMKTRHHIERNTASFRNLAIQFSCVWTLPTLTKSVDDTLLLASFLDFPDHISHKTVQYQLVFISCAAQCCPWIACKFVMYQFLDMQSDAALLHKRPRTEVDYFEADSSNPEIGCGDGGATQAMNSEGDTYGEIIGERVIMPHSWVFFSVKTPQNCLQSICNELLVKLF